MDSKAKGMVMVQEVEAEIAEEKAVAAAKGELARLRSQSTSQASHGQVRRITHRAESIDCIAAPGHSQQRTSARGWATYQELAYRESWARVDSELEAERK
jgi:hypothetical protein